MTHDQSALGSSPIAPASSSEDERNKAVERGIDISDGLGKLMLSVSSPQNGKSNSTATTTTTTTTNTTTATDDSTKGTNSIKSKVEPKGSLSVHAVQTVSSSSDQPPPQLNTAKPMFGKKVSSKKSIVKKLGTTGDVKIQSFEALEKEANKNTAVAAAQKKALEEKSSGRVSLMMDDEPKSSPSPYTGKSTTTSPRSPYAGQSKYSQQSSFNNYSSSNKVPVDYGSVDANRFKNKKAISSDAYFGRDESHTQMAQSRLNHFQGSNAISSDMIHGNGEVDGTMDDDDPIEKLKQSVAGFWSTLG